MEPEPKPNNNTKSDKKPWWLRRKAKTKAAETTQQVMSASSSTDLTISAAKSISGGRPAAGNRAVNHRQDGRVNTETPQRLVLPVPAVGALKSIRSGVAQLQPKPAGHRRARNKTTSGRPYETRASKQVEGSVAANINSSQSNERPARMKPVASPKATDDSRRRNMPKRPNNYAFIDSQNLNLGVQKIGWKMDWHRFRQWLADEYGVTQAYMFIGYMPDNESLYEQMYEHGFLVVLKPTLEIKNVKIEGAPEEPPKKVDENAEKAQVKGNIDTDLVLYAMKELPYYDKAVIVSGDGDFFSLAEYLRDNNKLLKLLVPNRRYSTLLQQFDEYIEGIDTHRQQLAYHDRRRRQTATSTRHKQ